MNVPFHSSGALNRAHYALVRDVENAQTAQSADQRLAAEVHDVRERLTRRAPTSKDCKAHLITLLYCADSISVPGLITTDALAFALPHALNLAQAGASISERRIGYLFCAAHLPPTHSLHLMLINTILKDLASPSPAQVAMGLEMVIASPSEIVLPAVQDKMYDLLGHTSPSIRRRALHAMRALACIDPAILTPAVPRIRLQLKLDPKSDPSVVRAALSAAVDAIKLDPPSSAPLKTSPDALLRASLRDRAQRWVLLAALRACRDTERPLPSECTDALRKLVEKHKGKRMTPLLLSLVRTLPSSPAALDAIRHLLHSPDPNAQYIFLACLDALDPSTYAGQKEGEGMDKWEVERVMGFLESRDRGIRRKTLRILHRIEPELVRAYFVQCQPPSDAGRALDAAFVLAAGDGAAYATCAGEVLTGLDEASVEQDAVEGVLTTIRDGEEAFRLAAVRTFLGSLSVPDAGAPGASAMIIVAALACEYAGKLGAEDVKGAVKGMARRLGEYKSAVQDACLLAMLRLVAECGNVPEEVESAVRALGEVAGKRVKRRCAMFGDMEALSAAVKRARSSSLPDFALALETPPSPPPPEQGTPRSPHPISPRTATSKLRYTAYEAPPTQTRGLFRRTSSASNPSSVAGGSRPGSRVSFGSPRVGMATLSPLMTPGELALVSGELELEELGKSPSAGVVKTLRVDLLAEETPGRTDLIALDSPFLSESELPVENALDDEVFERAWTALAGARAIRGWCEAGVEEVVKKLAGEVVQGGGGETKVMVPGDGDGEERAVLRLKSGEDEEGGCLWRMRCEGEGLRARIKGLLGE